MKQLLNPMAVLLSVAMLITADVAVNARAAEKENPQNEFPFNQVGTVTKHGVDTCTVGINYDLHSTVKAPLHQTTHWLVAVSESDKAILEKASTDGGLVRVKGTMMVGVEANCKWVKVSSVTPVKISS